MNARNRSWAVASYAATPDLINNARSRAIKEWRRDNPDGRYRIREWVEADAVRGIIEAIPAESRVVSFGSEQPVQAGEQTF